MFRIVTAFVFFLMISFSNNLTSQNTKKKPCSSKKHSQFDFWEGSWVVYDTKGKILGTNNLIKMQNNCVMQENWESKTGPSRGTSYNYYNKADDSWNQVWVDNTGFSLVLKGKLVDGKMVLKSNIIETKKGKYYNQITWTKNDDNSVTQLWEYRNENHEIISEVFKGIYKKE